MAKRNLGLRSTGALNNYRAGVAEALKPKLPAATSYFCNVYLCQGKAVDGHRCQAHLDAGCKGRKIAPLTKPKLMTPNWASQGFKRREEK